MPQSVPSINAVAGSNVNLPINTLVQLNNVNSGGETSYLWQIIAQPLGAADALSSTIIQNPTFTPTKEGTYLISLTVNGTLTARIVAAVRELKSLTRVPAPQEKTEAGVSAGWATDVNAMLLVLLNSQADPGVLVGVAGSTGCNAGTVLFMSGSSVLKSGLPGEEDVPTFTLADYGTTAGYKVYTRREPLYLSLGGVDGDTTPASGAIIRARLFGLQEFAVGGAAVGDAIYASSAGALGTAVSLIPRQVGVQASATHVYFDGRYVSEAALDLANTLIADVPVGAAGKVRLAARSNALQVSSNGGAYAQVAVADAPILTNGASAVMTNEVNIQSLTAALNFIAGSSSGSVNVRRFDNADTGNKFTVQTQGGVVLAAIQGDGDATFENVTAGGVDATIVTVSRRVEESSSSTASAANMPAPDFNNIVVTGTTDIKDMGTLNVQVGTRVTLYFTASLVLTHLDGAPAANFADFYLAGAVNFNATADDNITVALINDGSNTYWREVARTIG